MQWATAVGLEKMSQTENRQTENREHTENRESSYRGHSNPVDHWVEGANIQFDYVDVEYM